MRDFTEGLPINVLIAANRWKDTTSLAVAERVEQLMGGYKPPSLIHSLQ